MLVSRSDFIAEAKEVLQSAEEGQQALRTALKGLPSDDAGSDETQRLQALLTERNSAMQCVVKAIELATAS